MADNVDDANNMAELHLAAELAKPKVSLPPLTGSCYYCDALTAVMTMIVTNAEH
jgi:hypothetical protein